MVVQHRKRMLTTAWLTGAEAKVYVSNFESLSTLSEMCLVITCLSAESSKESQAHASLAVLLVRPQSQQTCWESRRPEESPDAQTNAGHIDLNSFLIILQLWPKNLMELASVLLTKQSKASQVIQPTPAAILIHIACPDANVIQFRSKQDSRGCKSNTITLNDFTQFRNKEWQLNRCSNVFICWLKHKLRKRLATRAFC